MRVTSVLCKQHIGKGFIRQWMVKGKKVPIDTGAHKILLDKNIKICTPEEVLATATPQLEHVEPVGIKPKPFLLDNTHPNWNDRVCLTYKDHNVLLEGLDQAKVVTKTVELKDGLPDKLKPKEVLKEVHNKVKNIILYSHLLDAEQQKLPKLKDPLRPAWNFPRSYGVTEKRVNLLLISKLINLMEMHSKDDIVKSRHILNNLEFSFPFEKAGDLIQLQLRGDTLLTSSSPLSPINPNVNVNIDLPKLFPIKETVTLNRENIYELKDIYPINKSMNKCHPHTVFVHYNKTEVKNLYEEPITENQILSRNLLKAFTVAATYARQQHGVSVQKLPKPVTVQCVQTDGQHFDFGVYQLNTLDLDTVEGPKNVWYQSGRVPLFKTCEYHLGRPVLEGYNKEVINQLFSFYENI